MLQSNVFDLKDISIAVLQSAGHLEISSQSQEIMQELICLLEQPLCIIKIKVKFGSSSVEKANVEKLLSPHIKISRMLCYG